MYYKSGQYITLHDQLYLVLGYSDYKRKILIVADKHGNTNEIYECISIK